VPAKSLYSCNFYRDTLGAGETTEPIGWPDGYVAVFKALTLWNDGLTSYESGGVVLVQAITNPEDPAVGAVFAAISVAPAGGIYPIAVATSLGFSYGGPDSYDDMFAFQISNTFADQCHISLDGYLLRYVAR
jgi:hypothetical protein